MDRLIGDPLKAVALVLAAVLIGTSFSGPGLWFLAWIGLAMFGVLVADLTASEEARDADVQWDLKNDDGKDVASGMYIVTIDTGDKVVTRKIMVIK